MAPPSAPPADPRKWLPPPPPPPPPPHPEKKPAFARYANLIKLQIECLQIAGHHQYSMPNFLGRKCLKKNTNGETEYDFGEESHFQSLTDHPCVTVKKTKEVFWVVLAGKDS